MIKNDQGLTLETPAVASFTASIAPINTQLIHQFVFRSTDAVNKLALHYTGDEWMHESWTQLTLVGSDSQRVGFPLTRVVPSSTNGARIQAFRRPRHAIAAHWLWEQLHSHQSAAALRLHFYFPDPELDLAGCRSLTQTQLTSTLTLALIPTLTLLILTLILFLIY